MTPAPARLILVRHGNTFREGEIPRRVGRRTDLPLVEEVRAEKAARFLLDAGLRPDRVFAAPLRRTMETAGIIVKTMGLSLTPIPADAFSEIDYGPDENRTEEEVMLRLGRVRLPGEADRALLLEEGKSVLAAWDRDATVPPGWNADADAIKNSWKAFAGAIALSETALLVSSNGVIRFAPHVLKAGYADFCAAHNIKVSTGGVCVFENDGGGWTCPVWNSKPI